MSDLIDREEALTALRDTLKSGGKSKGLRPVTFEMICAIKSLPSAEPWVTVKTMLRELEQKEERLYSDYCDATAKLKAINKIARSSQKPNQKINGINALAEMEVEE